MPPPRSAGKPGAGSAGAGEKPPGTPGPGITAEHRELLGEGLRALGVPAGREVVDSLLLFLRELLLWNARTNLVGSADPGEIITRHILDSLTAYPLVKGEKRPILDVGAGAGFPSLPLSVALRELRVYAVERRRKRAAFLRNVSVMLGLERYTVVERDVRHVSGRYGVILSRAVAGLYRLQEDTGRLREDGAVIIAYKGKLSEIDREMEQLRRILPPEAGYRFRVEPVRPPSRNEERNIVIIETP
ncbi:MAG: 16S rRNA (guanine(527)-N(7))-methyltransferase RsmG [Spirochaetota bacterium]